MNLFPAATTDHDNAAAFRARDVFDGVEVYETAGRRLVEQFTLDRQGL